MIAYDVIIKRQAKKKLQSLPLRQRARIAEQIVQLGRNPDATTLDIKKMVGQVGTYRLRIGDWRVVFERQDDIKIIAIEKIGARGDVYK